MAAARDRGAARDLNEKIVKLTGFLFGGDELRSVSPEDQTLLREQLTHMQAYSAVLCRRIITFRPRNLTSTRLRESFEAHDDLQARGRMLANPEETTS